MDDVNSLFFNNAMTDDYSITENVISELIKGARANARLTNSRILVIDFDSHNLLYRSQNMPYLDEAGYEDVQRECEHPYWGLIKKDTLDFLLEIKENYLMAGKDMTLEEYSTHICTIDYPIVIKKHEFFINQKFTPLVMRTDGITRIGVFTVGPSTSDELSSFFITDSGKRWCFNRSRGCYEVFNLSTTLSVVEKVILGRVQKGFTIEQIADNLNLSVSTIKTHRMRIFKKLHVQSISEALTVIGNYHLL